MERKRTDVFPRVSVEKSKKLGGIYILKLDAVWGKSKHGESSQLRKTETVPTPAKQADGEMIQLVQLELGRKVYELLEIRVRKPADRV